MKIIYNAVYEDQQVEGFFNEAGEMLGMWNLNDARWRHEYFNGFMKGLGFKVIRSEKAEHISALAHMFGETYIEPEVG